MMKRYLIVPVVLLFAVVVASHGWAQAQVGLGASFGVALPQGETGDVKSDDWKAKFDWGFYVDIPLIYVFHITPSAELYKFKDVNATDICLGFKFIIPLGILDLYLGAVPGITTVGDTTSANVGALVGASFNLISNLGLFVQGKYKFMFEGDSNIRVVHINAGVLYHF